MYNCYLYYLYCSLFTTDEDILHFELFLQFALAEYSTIEDTLRV